MQIVWFLSSWILLLGASSAFASCFPNLEFVGDPITWYTQENLKQVFRNHPASLEQFPSGKVPVRHFRFEHLWIQPDYQVTAKIKGRLTPVEIDGMTMFVRPAGVLAKAIARAGLDQDESPQPLVHYVVDYFDGAKFSLVSPLTTSPARLEIKSSEATSAIAKALEAGRSTAPAGPLENEMVRLTHSNPIQECFVMVDSETAGFACAPLSEEDVNFAREMSLILEDVAVAISAVTLGDIEYQAVFKDGVDVTERSFRLLTKAEKALENR